MNKFVPATGVILKIWQLLFWAGVVVVARQFVGDPASVGACPLDRL